MRMHYRQRKNNISRFGIGVAILILIVCFVVYTFLPQIAMPIAQPILVTANRIGDGFGNMFDAVRFTRTERDQTDLLQAYKRELDDAVLSVELLESENALLRRELGLRRTGIQGDVSASVLSYPPITPFDIVVIDIGSENKVAEGDRVFAGNRILIGSLSTVAHNLSHVSLFSTPDRKTEGLIARTETAVVLTGVGNGAFEFIAPEDFDIEIGDLIVTPGNERYALGRVIGIDVDSNASFSTIFIEQPINIRNIQWVRIENQRT